MLAEIIDSQKWLILYEEDHPEIIWRRYQILAMVPEGEGWWIFFTDGKGDMVKIMTAWATLNEDGSLASISWKIDKALWHKLHALWQSLDIKK